MPGLLELYLKNLGIDLRLRGKDPCFEVKARAAEIKSCAYEVKISAYEIKICRVKLWALKFRHGSSHRFLR